LPLLPSPFQRIISCCPTEFILFAFNGSETLHA
jgi:hypothetical protein